MDKLKQVLLAVVIGSLVGIAAYRLVSDNKFPFKFQPVEDNAKIEETQTQTIVQEENAIISVVEKTSPSVVAISINRRTVNPFDPFSIPRSEQSTIGTGFVVSREKGVIVTNRHVVADISTKYTVIAKDGKTYEVQQIYRDPNLDLAIIQVAGLDIPQLELGDSSKLKVGQTAIAIGNALGRFSNTVTTGVVSGLGRAVVAGDPYSGETERLDNLIQTDAAINPGNSGGPLLNSIGQVIGVNVATTEGAQNIGFTVPINSVKAIVNEFVSTGKVSRPFLGVRYQFVSKDLALLNEIPAGAYIREIIPNSPADKANINVGDVITKIDEESIDSENKVSEMIQSKKVGDSMSIVIWSQGGKERTIDVKLEESPAQ